VCREGWLGIVPSCLSEALHVRVSLLDTTTREIPG